MKKKLSLLLIFTVIFMLFSACSPFDAKISDKLKAPQPSGELYEIQKALSNVIGEVNYSYPRSGNYRGAVVTFNVDNFGNNEAFAFYSTKTDDSRVVQHISYICFKDGKWNVHEDVQIEGSNIYSVDFARFGNSSNYDLVFCVNSYTAKTKSVLVFSTENHHLTKYYEENTTSYALTDFDANGTKELLTLSLDTTLKTSTAKLTYFAEGNKAVSSNCNLDGTATEYKIPQVSTLIGGTSAVFIDAVTPSGMITEVLTAKNNTLTAIFNDKTTYLNTKTLRTSAIECADYNLDGSLDIPKTVPLPQIATINKADEVNLTIWQSFDGKKLSEIAETVINYTDGYYLEIWDELKDNFSIVRNLNQNERTFYEWLGEDGTLGTKIMTIRAFDYKKWDDGSLTAAFPQYKELARTSEKVFAYEVGESSLSPTLEVLKEHFHLINVTNGGIQ